MATWVGQINGNTDDMFTAVQGYFGILDPLSGSNAFAPIPITTTSTQMIFRDPRNLGEIRFNGNNLTVDEDFQIFGRDFPLLTGGTISSIEVYFNAALNPFITNPPRNRQEQNLFDIASNDTTYRLPQNINAFIETPNFSAQALGNAVVQMYSQQSANPIINFISQFDLIYTGVDDLPNRIGDEAQGIRGANGNDILDSRGGQIDNLFGGGGNDTLIAGSGTVGMNGEAGNDVYFPGSGSSRISDGFDDFDIVTYVNSNGPVGIDLNDLDGIDVRAGDAAQDTYGGIEAWQGSLFNDTIQGRNNEFFDSDILDGLAGDDFIVGYSGNDTLVGGPGFDTLVGGFGFDTAQFAVRSNEVHIYNLGGGVLLIAAPGGGVDRLESIEQLQFSNGIPTGITFSARPLFVGDPGNNRLESDGFGDLMFGRGGRDTLFGKGGNDDLDGERGSDTLVGGAGADTLRGGAGNSSDTASYTDSSAAVRASLSNPGSNEGDAAGDVYFSIENLIGSRQNDRLFGNSDNNRLAGFSGNDTIFGGGGDDNVVGADGNDRLNGGGGNDRLFGSDGNDTLFGNEGNDRLFGQNGRDVLNAGSGNDNMDGGSGNDTLNGGSGNDRYTGGSGSDRFVISNRGDRELIKDFQNNTDTIELDGLTIQRSFVSGNNAIFDFNQGGRMVIEGFTNINQITDDIVFT